MWPRTFDMSADECRRMLRKLELETYANVINTFRAHGVLDPRRLNILAELREIFGIDQDRHRSETRRATNDEHLTSIADKLFGDDCIIQWTREGKRGAPLLYRSEPYTSITITANAASEWVRRMNRHLPDPATVKRLQPDTVLPPKSNVILANPTHAQPIPTPMSILPHLLDDVVIHRNLSHSGSNNTAAVTTTAKCKKVPVRRAAKVRPEAKEKYTENETLWLKQVSGKSNNVRPTNKAKALSAPKRSKTAATTGTISGRKRGPNKQARQSLASTAATPGDCVIVDGRKGHPADFVPQIAKSKKDIYSNLSKLHQITANYTEFPPTMESERGSQSASRVSSNKIRDLLSINSAESATTVPVVSETIQSPPSQGILFNRLQRMATTNGSGSRRGGGIVENGSSGAVNGREPLSVDDEATMEATEVDPEELVESVVVDYTAVQERLSANGGGPKFATGQKVVYCQPQPPSLVELGASPTNVVMEISDDKIIFDMNESSEIIEEEFEHNEIMAEEEEYVTVEDEEDFDEGYANGTSSGMRTSETVTDFEYLLDTAGTNQILVEEVDANGFSQIRKANLMELMVAGHLDE